MIPEIYDQNNIPSIKLARLSARALIKQAKIVTYPILIKQIAEYIPNLEIDGQELEDEISGMQITFQGVSYIRYNQGHSLKRTRFTVAHEIGHAILGHTTEQCERNNNFGSKNPIEVEANVFAAELLMPLDILKKATRQLNTVDLLSRAFWVSKDAMSWRILSTGLIKSLKSWN